VDEQRNHAKKAVGTASPALKRLKDGAQVVRLIIEKCAADLPRKAVKAVFSHIVSIIVLKGQLFEPVSLEYLKSLRSIISYRPHLDHLETKQWTHAVALCFAGALGDPIKSQDIVEDAMMEKDDDTEMTQSAGSSNGRSKKRKAAGPLRLTPVDEDGYRSGSPAGFRSAGQDVIELMACIDAFFRSPASPFLACGEALLAKFIRFFRVFPSETSAHLPALTALNRLVQELYYNAKTALEKSSVILWPFLLSLWYTKNAIVKEQLVILLNRLLPFLLYRSDGSHTQLVQDLYNHILAEPENRWRSEDLDIDNLEMGEVSEQAKSRAFGNSLFRLSHGVTSAHVLSWATLQLGALCLSHLQGASQSLRPDLPPTPSSSRSKKRKVSMKCLVAESMLTETCSWTHPSTTFWTT
jgi:ataxia telangiectasia mutated family protein